MSQDLPFEGVTLSPDLLQFLSAWAQDTTLFAPKEPWLPPSWNKTVSE